MKSLVFLFLVSLLVKISEASALSIANCKNSSASVSNGGSYIAAVCPKKWVKIFDPSGKQLRMVSATSESLNVRFSKTETHLFINDRSGSDRVTKILDIISGIITVVEAPALWAPWDLSIPKKWLFIEDSGAAKVFNVMDNSLKQITILPEGNCTIEASVEGDIFAIFREQSSSKRLYGFLDSKMETFLKYELSLSSQQQLIDYNRVNERRYFSKDGRFFVIGEWRDKINVLEILNGTVNKLETWSYGSLINYTNRFTDNDDFIVMTTPFKIGLFDLGASRMAEYPVSGEPVWANFDPVKQRIFFQPRENNNIGVYDINKNSFVQIDGPLETPVIHILFFPRDRIFYVPTAAEEITAFDMDTLKSIGSLKIGSCCFVNIDENSNFISFPSYGPGELAYLVNLRTRETRNFKGVSEIFWDSRSGNVVVLKKGNRIELVK